MIRVLYFWVRPSFPCIVSHALARHRSKNSSSFSPLIQVFHIYHSDHLFQGFFPCNLEENMPWDFKNTEYWSPKWLNLIWAEVVFWPARLGFCEFLRHHLFIVYCCCTMLLIIPALKKVFNCCTKEIYRYITRSGLIRTKLYVGLSTLIMLTLLMLSPEHTKLGFHASCWNDTLKSLLVIRRK